MQKTFALLTLAVLTAPSFCYPQEQTPAPRRRVAVLAFENLRKDPDTDWVGAVTAETLATKLTAVNAMIVIERQQLNRVIQEQHFQQSDLVNPETARKAGRIAGAQSIVIGSFVVVGERVRFNAHIVDVQTGEILNAATITGDQKNLIDLPVQLADAVIESLSKKVLVVEGKPRVEQAAPAHLTDEERKKLAERPTQNTEAYEAFGRGVALDNKHRWKEAQAEYEKATELDPAFALAWLNLGNVHNKQGGWPKALECYGKAQVLFQAKRDEKNRAWALNNIGIVHKSQGRYTEAMKCYEDSLAISRKLGHEPGAARALNNIAIVHSSQRRYAEAMKCYEDSLAISRKLGDEPGVAKTLQNIGEVHRMQSRYDEAMKCQKESLATSRRLGDEPTVEKVLNNIGILYFSQGDFAEAMSCLEESLTISRRLGNEPGVASTLHNIGEVHRMQGQNTEAIKCYEESLALMRKFRNEPGEAVTLFSMALLYGKSREYQKALTLAREAAQIAHKLGLADLAKFDQLVTQLENKVAK